MDCYTKKLLAKSWTRNKSQPDLKSNISKSKKTGPHGNDRLAMASILAKGGRYREVAAIIVRQWLPSQGELTQAKYMLVKKPRKDHAWQFPQGGMEPGESVAEAALRELAEECGTDLRVKLAESDPVGTYQYLFPEAFVRQRSYPDTSIGAKVSFMRADWISGQCEPDYQEIVDFAWLNRDELQSYTSHAYFDAIRHLL